MYTVVLTGPKKSESQARNALARAGLSVRAKRPRSPGHGFSLGRSDGSIVLDNVPHPDQAVALASAHHFVLRSHHRPADSTVALLAPPPPSAESDLELRIAALERTIAEMSKP